MSDDDPAGAGPTGPRDPRFVARLAPFVAWLATGSLDESTRRTHRQVTEAFLNWCRVDPGPVRGRRRRYEQHVAEISPDRSERVRAGLDRWEEHCALVARTRSVDEG